MDVESATEIWVQALVLYLRDARRAMKGRDAPEYFEALDDLTGTRRLLANLCRPVGLDVDLVAKLFVELLNTGKNISKVSLKGRVLRLV